MKTYLIKLGILTIPNIDFFCPYCQKAFSDINDKYLKRCNKNKNGITKVKCECSNSFYMTYNYIGDAVAFKK